jgi:hypothetical protein
VSNLKTKCLSVKPLSESEVQDAADMLKAFRFADEFAMRLCLSHERLRAEFDGLVVLYDELQTKYGSLWNALNEIAGIANQTSGGDWDEIEKARDIALTALGMKGKCASLPTTETQFVPVIDRASYTLVSETSTPMRPEPGYRHSHTTMWDVFGSGNKMHYAHIYMRLAEPSPADTTHVKQRI